MDLTWQQLCTLDPALSHLEAEVRRRAHEHRGGAERWYVPLWIGTQGENGLREVLQTLVGWERGEVNVERLLADKTKPTSLRDAMGAARARVAQRAALTGPEKVLHSSAAYDVATEYLTTLLTTELNKAPLPVPLPDGDGIRGWKAGGPDRVVIVDDRIAALAGLLNLRSDLLLAAVLEWRESGVRLVHGLFARDGRLLAWDSLGVPSRTEFHPGVQLSGVEVLRAQGQDWAGALWRQVCELNSRWFAGELAATCEGYLDRHPRDVALDLLHFHGGRGDVPTWVRPGVEHEIVGLTTVQPHEDCPTCATGMSWGQDIPTQE